MPWKFNPFTGTFDFAEDVSGFARKDANETITGHWTFSHYVTFENNVTFSADAFFGDNTLHFKSSYTETIGGPTYYGDYSLYASGGYLYLSGTRDTGTPCFQFLNHVHIQNGLCVGGDLTFDDVTDKIAGIENQNLVDKTAGETITGLWQFDTFPRTPSSAPTSDYEVANKKYVDDNAVNDHSLLSNLNWSAAGHTFDTDLKLGAHYLYTGSSDQLKVGFDGNKHYTKNAKTYNIGEVFWQYDGSYYSSSSPYDTTFFKAYSGGQWGDIADIEFAWHKCTDDNYSGLKFPGGQIALKSWTVNTTGQVLFQSILGFKYKATYSGAGSTVFDFRDRNDLSIFSIYGAPSTPTANKMNCRCNIQPVNASESDKYTLGTSTQRWKYIYASQKVRAGVLAPEVKNLTSADSPYSADTYYSVILCDCSGGAITVNLPSAGEGYVYRIKKTDSSGNAVTVSPATGDTIEGASSASLSSQWDDIVLSYDNANNRWVRWN